MVRQCVTYLAGELLHGGKRKLLPRGSGSTLGLRWSPQTDQFHFQVQVRSNNGPVTKRAILGEVARLYDPLGWLAPVIVRAKVLLQLPMARFLSPAAHVGATPNPPVVRHFSPIKLAVARILRRLGEGLSSGRIYRCRGRSLWTSLHADRGKNQGGPPLRRCPSRDWNSAEPCY